MKYSTFRNGLHSTLTSDMGDPLLHRNQEPTDNALKHLIKV